MKILDYIKHLLYGKIDYNFIQLSDLPKGKYKSKKLSNISCIDWITTGDTEKFANNHCGATAVTNMAIYYNSLGFDNLVVNENKVETFREIHKIIGNGPVISISLGAKKYFKTKGYDLLKSYSISFKEIKKSIDENQILGVLLFNGILNWHWVIAVGYREYENGEKYLQVVNGWENSSSIFFKLNDGVVLVFATKYWIEKL